jgi:enamine deaminase RidA (YjgF/YER057c/UK114 family)
MSDITRIAPGPRMSRAAVHGDVVYLAGHVSTIAGGVRAQTADILTKIETVLAEAGTEKSRILSVQIWLADIATFNEMNEVYDAWVDKANPPTRATVEAKLAAPEYLVEIAAIAAK